MYDSTTLKSKCAKCATGYALKSDYTLCTAYVNNQPQNNCNIFEGNAGAEECKKCNDGYYLYKDGSNKKACKNSDPVTNCLTIFNSDDQKPLGSNVVMTPQTYN